MTKTDIRNLTLGALGVLASVIYSTTEDQPWWARGLGLVLLLSGFYMIYVATRETREEDDDV